MKVFENLRCSNSLMLNVSCLFLLLLLTLYTRFAYVTAASSSSASVNDSTRLIHDMLDTYDHRLRPVLNQTQPVDVYFTFHLLSLLEIDEVQQRIHINAWVNFSWWDEIRTWDPSDYYGMDILHPDPLDIWRPRTIVANSIGPRDIFADDYAPLYILASGSTTWSPSAMFYLTCEFDLTYFPFDSQTCQARILANDLAKEINIIPTQPFVLVGGYTEHGEWELKSTSVTKSVLLFGDRSYYVRVIISLTYDRRPTYYLLNFLCPVMVLSFLSLFGFVVPKESGERVSFAITVLLSLAVFLGVVSGQLPPSSDTFPYISIYIFSLLCLSAFSVFIIVCQSRLVNFFSEDERDEKQEPDFRDSLKGNYKNVKEVGVKGNNADKKSKYTLATNEGFEADSSLNSDSVFLGNGSDMKHSTHVRNQETASQILYSDHTGQTILSQEDSENKMVICGLCHGNTRIDVTPQPTAPSSSSSSPSSSSPSSGTTQKLKTICHKLFLSYDDLILFLIFLIAWVVFTVKFFHKILNYEK